MQEAAEMAKKKLISQRLKVVQVPSLVNRGAKMVKARMVAVGNRTFRRAVPLRTALITYM